MARSVALESISCVATFKKQEVAAILKSAFGNHPRTLTLINAFSEGIYLCNADVGVNAELQALSW